MRAAARNCSQDICHAPARPVTHKPALSRGFHVLSRPITGCLGLSYILGTYNEPTGNLDTKTSADVLGLLKRTSNEFNQTIVMITHNNEIAQLADRIVRIEDGRIVE